MKERIRYIDYNLTRLIQKKCETLRKRQTKTDKQKNKDQSKKAGSMLKVEVKNRQRRTDRQTGMKGRKKM